MRYVVIGICVFIILLAIYILVRNIIRASKGKCCESCKGCASKDKCNHEK